MLLRNSFTLCLLFILLFSCKKKEEQTITPIPLAKNNEYLFQSVLWYQRSGEMMALYYQGYNLATITLNQYLKSTKSKKKKAVIVDIDETVLNNSPYEARLIRTDSLYTNHSWNQWVTAASADTLPGAFQFLTYAKSKGVETFYVSNRDSQYVLATIKNLKRFDLPDADEKHVLLKGDKENGKETRRNLIAKEYDIILLCGDNLSDFYFVFDNREGNNQQQRVTQLRTEFGKRFIIFPNPMYGDWEKPFYGKTNWTATQRDSIRKASILHQ